MDTSGLEYIGATTSAPAPPVDPPSNGGSHALSGVPPPIFNGDRDKSELFLDKFMSYEIVNGDNRQFTTPVPQSGLVPIVHERTQDRFLGLPPKTLAQSRERRRRVHDGPVPLGQLRGQLP